MSEVDRLDRHRLNAFERDGRTFLRCDALGCNESHPIEHEMLGEESFGTGRWMGWLYLDLNRPDLFDREFRFCQVSCALWWLESNTSHRYEKVREPLGPLDRALRSPNDALARKRSGLGRAGATLTDEGGSHE